MNPNPSTINRNQNDNNQPRLHRGHHVDAGTDSTTAPSSAGTSFSCQLTVNVRDAFALGPPLRSMVRPVNTRVVDVPAELVSVTVAV